MTEIKSFFKALNNEEEKFLPVLASDNLGLLMRCAINELDWFYYNYAQTNEPTTDQQEQFYILQIGTARLIKLALESRDAFDLPVVTTQRRPELSVRVLEIASALGMIQHGRRVAQSVTHGMGSIEKTGSREFTITLPDEIEDEGFYEREVLEHYNRESRRLFGELTHDKKWQQLEQDINKTLCELVYPFREHYIGYGADPILDEYFFGLASYEVSLQEGYDTYHYTVKFGGIRIQHYMLALTFLVSISIRHERFAAALVRKAPEVKLENVLTISADVDPLIESLRDAVNHFGVSYESFEEINLSQAKQIFEILSCSRENIKLIDPPGSPYPLLVKCSEFGVIRTIFGARSEPVRFLLEALRFHFPEDYSRNQAHREGSLQRATRRVLGNVFSGLNYHENVAMRLNGYILSDIDLVVLEKATGTILLCQLKHQELYGADIHSKSVRTKRLRTQVREWLGAVDRWLAQLGMEDVKKALQLPKDWSQEPRLCKIVISRHFAYPLKDIVSGDCSAFASWPQFFNANELVKRDFPKPTLLNLVKILQDTQSIQEKIAYLPEPTTKWKIHELVFITRQGPSKRT